MSSPRGLLVGGMEGIGADDGERLPRRVGDGLRRVVGEEGGETGGGGDVGRGKRYVSGLYGEPCGAFRVLRYMLKLLNALFACGTYLCI